MQISPEQFESILPLAVKWAEAKEKVILEHGTALSPQYMEDAGSIGVRFPEKVWIYEVPQIPIPKHPMPVAFPVPDLKWRKTAPK